MMHSSQRSEPRRSKMCVYHQDIYRLVAEPQLRNKKATRRSTQTKKKEPTNHSELLLDRSDNGCHHGIRDKIMDCIISPPRQPTRFLRLPPLHVYIHRFTDLLVGGRSRKSRRSGPRIPMGSRGNLCALPDGSRWPFMVPR